MANGVKKCTDSFFTRDIEWLIMNENIRDCAYGVGRNIKSGVIGIVEAKTIPVGVRLMGGPGGVPFRASLGCLLVAKERMMKVQKLMHRGKHDPCRVGTRHPLFGFPVPISDFSLCICAAARSDSLVGRPHSPRRCA